MLSGLWAKLVGVMGAALAIMGVMLKFKNHKIDELEEENAAHEKKDEIIEDMALAKVKAKDKRDEAIKNIDDTNWRDRI